MAKAAAVVVDKGMRRAHLLLATVMTLTMLTPAWAQTPDSAAPESPMATAPVQTADPAASSTPSSSSSPVLPPVAADAAPAAPPMDSAPTSPPPLAPADAISSAASPQATPAPPPDAAPVGVQSLATLDLFSAGRVTGLGTDLWKGSSADIARAVIPTLDTAPLSPAGAALARAVLATAAIAPDGAGEDTVLAAARVKALLDLGDADGAGMILDRTPGLSSSAALSQAAAEVALITDQPDKACAVADALSVDRDAVYWLRLRAFCQARAGKTDMAQLTLTLANQQAPDPIFGRLMGAILAGGGDPGPPSLRNGLDYALSTQLKLDLTPALAHAAPPIARRLAALVPPPPPPPVAPPETPVGATSVSASPPPAPVIFSESDVLAMLRGPTTLADYIAAAKTAQPAIAGLVQVKAPLTAPITLATAAIAADDLADADAIRAGMGDAPAADAGDLAILDATLAAAHGRPETATLDRVVARGGQGGGQGAKRAQAAAAMVAALGTAMSPGARAAFAGFSLNPDGAPLARLLALDLAADAGLKGETALEALFIAEAGGASGPGLADRVRIVRALIRAGLGANAQAFAIEGLVQLQTR